MRTSSGRTRLQRAHDFVRFRKPVRRVLREDHAAVGDDVEHASLPLNQFRFDAERRGERSRQPGGLWTVVSTNAKADLNGHDPSIIRRDP
jgi:hypothetical protein